MFSIFRKEPKTWESAIEPTQEESFVLPMKIAMVSWELTKLKMKLFQLHGESGRRLCRRVEILLEGNEERIRELNKEIFSDKSIKKAKKSIDDVKNEIQKIIYKNFILFQMANFILNKNGKEMIDLHKLQISDEEINKLFNDVTVENIYDKLDGYREHLDSFLDKINNICFSLSTKLTLI